MKILLSTISIEYPINNFVRLNLSSDKTERNLEHDFLSVLGPLTQTRMTLMFAESPNWFSQSIRRGCSASSNDAINRRNELVLKNLVLVRKIARAYSRSQNELFDDLFQEGFIGLMKAAEKFDPSRGFRFSSLVGVSIKGHILRALETKEGSLVRVPAQVIQKMRDLAKFKIDQEQKTGNSPSFEALSELLGMDIDSVRALFAINKPNESIDSPLQAGDNSQSRLGDRLVAPEDVTDHIEKIDKERLWMKIHLFLRRLSPEELKLIDLIFVQDFTLDEVENQLGISSHNARSMLKKIYDKLWVWCNDTRPSAQTRRG